MYKISTFSLAHQNNIFIHPSVLYMENSLGVNKPIAIRLIINPKSNMASWEDTTRGHSINIKEYTINEKEVKITSSDDAEWKFVPLTLEIFNKIKKDLIPINKEFQSDEELEAFYSNANFNW